MALDWGLSRPRPSALNNMGRAYNNLGKREEALKVLNEAMSIWHEIDSGSGSRRMMSSRDRMHNLGQLKDLKEQRDEMPAKWREEGGHAGEASTLDNLGRTYADMGQGRNALDYFNQALPLWRDAGEQGGEALTLNNMGQDLCRSGQEAEGPGDL